MAVGVGEGLLAFLSGVQEGGEKIDEKLALQMKALKDTNPDENLKSKYTAEFAKFEKDKELIRSIESAGGLGTLKGLQIAGGYDSLDEFKKALDLDPTLINSIKMPVKGEEPVYTPSTYGVTNRTEDGKSRSTVSKAFNSLFRPEVFEENEAYSDANPATEGTTTTYRRGKGTDITSAQEKNARKSLQNLRNKNKPQKLTKQIQTEDGGWEEVTFTRNENGTTGNEAKALGGKYSLYAGYSVTNTTPWQDPTKQKDGTTLDYTMMFAVNSDGNFVAPDELTRSDMEQVPVTVKAIKTGNPDDKIAIQGGTLEGYKYLERTVVEDTGDSSTGTADMQNSDFEVEQFIAMYKASPERKRLMDKKLVAMGLPPGEMTEMAARELLTNFKSFEQNVNSGNYMDVQSMWLGVGDTSSRDEAFDIVQPTQVADYTLNYLPSQEYYNDLKEPEAYDVFINSQSQYFANKHKIPVATAVNVIEKIAKTGIENESGSFMNFVKDWTSIGNVLTFDSNRKVLGNKTIADLIAEMEKFKTDPELANEPWEKIADYVVGQITKAR
tara:strand:- start:2543 stop:4201 length:1659 start_codon:yes stop_codon:yes gene_type:complete